MTMFAEDDEMNAMAQPEVAAGLEQEIEGETRSQRIPAQAPRVAPQERERKSVNRPPQARSKGARRHERRRKAQERRGTNPRAIH